MIHIIYYVYVNHPHNWIGTVQGQLEDIISSDLLKMSHLHICLSGNQKTMNQAKEFIDRQFKSVHLLSLDYSFTEENLYEYPGIHKMYTLGVEHPDDTFLYMHTKSVSRSNSPTTRTNDNIYLTRMTLWNYNKINAIFNNYPHVNKIGLFPSTGGWIWFNFFWVRGSYLAGCREPVISPRRHCYEDWLGTSYPKPSLDCYSLYNDQIGFNFRPYLACQLLHKLYVSLKFVILNNTIKEVTYGIERHQIDVTKKFIELIERTKHININNSISGIDPHFGIRKNLVIKLSDGQKIDLLEGETVLINIMHKNLA